MNVVRIFFQLIELIVYLWLKNTSHDETGTEAIQFNSIFSKRVTPLNLDVNRFK